MAGHSITASGAGGTPVRERQFEITRRARATDLALSAGGVMLRFVSPDSRAVMSKSVFTRAGSIYAPFEAEEVRRMRRFVDQVDRLRGFSFFEHPSHRMKATFAGGVVCSVRADAPGTEATYAVVPIFRELYNPRNSTSADQILGLLTRHAHDRASGLRDEAIADLRGLRDGLKWRRKVDPRGSLLEENPDRTVVARTPESIIDTWLNGEYLHFDEPKAAEIIEGHPTTEMMRFMLLSAIRDFSTIWGHVRNAAFAAMQGRSLPP